MSEASQNIDSENYITEYRELCAAKRDECDKMTAELIPRPGTLEEDVQESLSEYNLCEALKELTSGFENVPNDEDDTVYLMASSPPKDSSSPPKQSSSVVKNSSSPPQKSASPPKKSSSHLLPEERETRSKSKSPKVARISMKQWLSTKFDKFFKKGSHSTQEGASAASVDVHTLLHQEIDKIRVSLSMLDRAIDNFEEIAKEPGSSPELVARKRVVRALKDGIVQECEAVAKKILEIKSDKEKELTKRIPGVKIITEKSEDAVQSPAKKHKGATSQEPGPSTGFQGAASQKSGPSTGLKGATSQELGPSTVSDGASSSTETPKKKPVNPDKNPSVHIFLGKCTSYSSETSSSKDTLSTRVSDSETEDSKDDMDES